MKKTAPVILCLFIFLAFTSLTASAQGGKHTLQKGETLYAVSRLYKVPYEALAAANGVTDPTKVKVGTVLIIPSVHQAAKGETLFGIARQYGVTLGQLLSANKLGSGYILKVGDILIIPASAAADSPASTAAGAASTSTFVSTTLAMPAPSAPSTTKANTLGSTTSTKAMATTLATATTTSVSNASSSTVSTVQSPPTTLPVRQSPAAQLPDPVKIQDRSVDASLKWPAFGKAMYLEGKLEGVMIRVKPGETAKAIAAGTIVSAGPSRGFGQVVFVQAKSGYVYVYGGIESLGVKTGDHLVSGNEIGKIGVDAKDGAPIAYFFVFRNGQPIDPATAPRD